MNIILCYLFIIGRNHSSRASAMISTDHFDLSILDIIIKSAKAGQLADPTGRGMHNTTSGTETGTFLGTKDCDLFLLLVSCVLVGVCCCMGYVTNALSIVVWGRRRPTSPFSRLLQALAAADTLLLATSPALRVVNRACFISFEHPTCNSYIYHLYPFLVKYLWPVGTVAHSCTIWLTVLLAANRYVAVCRPLHAPRLIRTSYIMGEVAIVVVASLLYCLPRFFEYDIKSTVDPEMNITFYSVNVSSLFVNQNYQMWYRIVSFFLIMNIIPLLILLVLTFKLIRTIQEASKQRRAFLCIHGLSGNQTQRGQNEENSMTITLTAVVIVFMVCQLPAALNRVFYMAHFGQFRCGQFFYYFSHCSDLMVFLNASVNFYVYCFCCSRFRADFRRLFRCRKKSSAARPRVPSLTTSFVQS